MSTGKANQERARCIVPLRSRSVTGCRIMTNENPFHRRSIRLVGANYSEPGGYFLTICAAGRKQIFGRIESARTVLSPLGGNCPAMLDADTRAFPAGVAGGIRGDAKPSARHYCAPLEET